MPAALPFRPVAVSAAVYFYHACPPDLKVLFVNREQDAVQLLEAIILSLPPSVAYCLDLPSEHSGRLLCHHALALACTF